MSVRDNLRAIRESLEGKNVTILGVTKGQPAEKIQEALDAGLTDFGNNYTKEGQELRKTVRGGHWHFIGNIQSRKAKELLDYDLVQSLDRIEIAEAFQSRLEKSTAPINVLIEVNLGEESSKSGIAPGDLDTFLTRLAPLSRVRVRGLMVLPPPLMPVEARRPFFKKARTLFAAHQHLGWDTLSMGTSDDYLIAAEEGATLVRLGTILFGPRK